MKFEEIKKIAAWDVLMQLQQKTRENIGVIKENSETIRMVLNGEVTVDSIHQVQVRNNELLKENSDNLRLHNALLSYLKSLQNADDFTTDLENVNISEPISAAEEVKKLGFDEFLQMTIDGLVVFDASHPYYCSDDFKAKLIQYYSSLEEYEKCALLSNSNCSNV